MNEAQQIFGMNGKLKRSLDDVVNAAEALLRETADDTNAEYRKARKALDANIRAAKSNASEHAHEIASGVKEIGAKGDRFVRENPWASIGAGAAIGLLLGVLLRKH